MRKFILIIGILFSFVFSFLFIDNVGATVTESVSISQNTFKNYVQPLTDNMKIIRSSMLSNMNYNSNNQDYFCLFNSSSGNPYGSCFVFNKNSGVTFGLKIYDYGSTASNHQLHYFFVLNNPNNSSVSFGKYKHNTSYTSQYGFTINGDGYNSSATYSYGNLTKSGSLEILITYNDMITYNNNNINVLSFNPYRYSWVEASTNFKFFNNVNSSQNTITSLNAYATQWNNLINTYLPNDDLFDNNIDFIPSFIVPTLSFSTINNYDSLNNITSVDVQLNIDNYDSNSIYQMQFNSTSGTWTTLAIESSSNNGGYYLWDNWSQNGTFYIRVLHNNQVVSTATLTIEDIVSYQNVSSVIDLGDNHFGYFSNYVLVQNVKSTSENNLVSILCERDRAFDNGFCSLFYSDLISNHSNIDYFNDTTFAFHTLFGDANNILVSNKYYVFNFRVLKPFVPDISNVVLSTNYGDINLSNNFDKVYYNDGGSYTDYAIVFNTNNISLDSSYNLNSISVYFSVPLSNYYYNNIPDSFSFSIYRSFKLSYYDTIPDSNEISNLFSINNLSSIDGVNSQHLFFTDTTFNTYGFGGIISAPFRLLYALEDYDTCSDISIPFPHSNQTLTLKCVRSSIPSSINPLISILQIVLSGLICYRIAVSTLALIKQVLNPNDTNIEVVDL